MHKAKKHGGDPRYSNGQFRCGVCHIYLYEDGVNLKPFGRFCKCCGFKVRGKPRSPKNKELFRQSQDSVLLAPIAK